MSTTVAAAVAVATAAAAPVAAVAAAIASGASVAAEAAIAASAAATVVAAATPAATTAAATGGDRRDLFDPDVAIMPSIYREIGKRLDRRGANLGIHSTRRIPTLLADRIYGNSPDEDLAMQLATAIITGHHRSTSGETTSNANTRMVTTTTTASSGESGPVALE